MSVSAILKNIATLGFVGYLPVAPGTFGTAASLVFFLLVKPSFSFQLLLLALFVTIGFIASDRAEQILKEKDSSHIVIDEFAGYAMSVLALPPTFTFLLAAFLLFRVFDILKPPPIRWIEKVLPGGAGIMADDVIAGIYTNALLQVWKVLG